MAENEVCTKYKNGIIQFVRLKRELLEILIILPAMPCELPQLNNCSRITYSLQYGKLSDPVHPA